MPKYEIRLSTDDVEERDHFKIAVKYYEDDDCQKSGWVILSPEEAPIIKGDLGKNEEILGEFAEWAKHTFFVFSQG
ncbi:hypothetical protein [Pseudomonas triticifolii]|uniref:Uncharacterized protein n=1 Tax=Pseudomonas triticifolii TaxID=2762592 RepID=A0ABR7BLH7_9PSED|nr:hypothetical protein [Pseudomonas triticifolii]MBC3958012.1 hypothetical protein [Pseudomonas triticifolii]